MADSVLRLEFEKGSYSQVKAVYWNDEKLANVLGVDISFSGSEWPCVRVQMALVDVEFDDKESIKALVEFESQNDGSVVCEHCGTKQDIGRSKCISCGAPLKG
jgi:hypothetical protein